MFRSTPLREGRRRLTSRGCAFTLFRSTPLREGRRPGERQRRGTIECFDPRPCARGDHSADRLGRIGRCFDPRPCARGDTSARSHASVNDCFDPRPCARGDPNAPMTARRGIAVSIHAPARGATRCVVAELAASNVSIHAPARGATSRAYQRDSRRYRFDPRPCARGDRLPRALNVGTWFRSTPLREGRRRSLRHQHVSGSVSIHAPARGATRDGGRGDAGASMFRSTPLREGRPAHCALSSANGTFRSTPLREGRRSLCKPFG